MKGSCNWESKSSHKVRPNCITFSACINGCPWTIAMHLLDQMQSNGIQPNTVTLNTVRCLSVEVCRPPRLLYKLDCSPNKGHEGLRITAVADRLRSHGTVS